jgi:hypothetical protein
MIMFVQRASVPVADDAVDSSFHLRVRHNHLLLVLPLRCSRVVSGYRYYSQRRCNRGYQYLQRILNMRRYRLPLVAVF